MLETNQATLALQTNTFLVDAYRSAAMFGLPVCGVALLVVIASVAWRKGRRLTRGHRGSWTFVLMVAGTGHMGNSSLLEASQQVGCGPRDGIYFHQAAEVLHLLGVLLAAVAVSFGLQSLPARNSA